MFLCAKRIKLFETIVRFLLQEKLDHMCSAIIKLLYYGTIIRAMTEVHLKKKNADAF